MNEEQEYQQWKEEQEYQQWKAGQSEPAEVYSGWVKGLRDPVDALSQMLYEAVPDSVKESGDKLNNWIADKTGLLETIPEGGFSEQLKQQEDKYQAGRKAEGDEGVDWDRIGGNVVSTMAPGVGVARAAAPATMIGKVALGAGTGAGYGALTPTHEEDFWPAKGKQMGIGAMFGGAIPVAGAMAKGGAHYVDELTKPLYKSGIARDVKKFMVEHAGSERDKIISALQRSRQMVPGNKPTSGQAIAQSNIPGKGFGGQFVKLENEVSRQPVTGRVLKDVYGQQATGRESAIKAIAGTDDALKAAEKARDTSSLRNYGAAYNKKVKITSRTPKVIEPKPTGILDASGKPLTSKASTGYVTKIESELRNLLKDPFLKKAVPTANNLAKANNITLKSNPTKYLHYVKIGIDKQLAKTGDDALSNTEKRAASAIKDKLVGWLSKKNSSYDVARAMFAKQSVPINRMNVGKELNKALVDALEREKPSTFAGAVRNAPRTLKRSTGFNRYDKLEDVLSQQQAKSVRNVSDELANQAKAKAMATETGSILKDLPGEVTLSLPHILSRPIVVANHVLGMIGKDKTPQYKEMIATILKDPKEFEKILTLPGESVKKRIAADILRELTTFSAVKSEQQGAN